MPSHPTWGGAKLRPPLSGGMSVLKAVGPSLVEKVESPCVAYR
jgi:hypothetical protein